jgi:hypothetical protein
MYMKCLRIYVQHFPELEGDIFCLYDLISEDPEVQKRASSNLLTKIKRNLIYNSLLVIAKNSVSSKQKDTCRTRIAKNSKQEIKNIFIEDENNSIRIQAPYSLRIKDKDTPLTVTDYVKLKTVVNKSLSIDRGYLRRKGGKTYVYGPNTIMPYLDLLHIDNKHLASNSKRTLNNRYSLNLRGLMLLLLSEENPDKFNCILRNLAKTDNDVEIKRDFNGLAYTVKENYPFLSIYFEQFLKITGIFVFNCLKDIAIGIQGNLDKISLEELKYIVTREFYSRIESRRWDNTKGMDFSSLMILDIPGVPKEVSIYKLSILYYLRTHIEDELFLIDAMIDDNKSTSQTQVGIPH